MGKKALCFFVVFVFLCNTSVGFALAGSEYMRPVAESLSACLEEISAAVEGGNISAGQMANIIEHMNYLLEDLDSDGVIIEQNQCEIEWLVVTQMVLHLLRSVYSFFASPSVSGAFEMVISALDLVIEYLMLLDCLNA